MYSKLLGPFDLIFVTKLSLWTEPVQPQICYSLLLDSLPVIEPTFPLFFPQEFAKPFNDKTRYCSRYTNNCKHQFLNDFYSMAKAVGHAGAVMHPLLANLPNELISRIRMAENFIRTKNLGNGIWDAVTPQPGDDPTACNSGYILHLLKFTLSSLLAEVQHYLQSVFSGLMLHSYAPAGLLGSDANIMRIEEPQPGSLMSNRISPIPVSVPLPVHPNEKKFREIKGELYPTIFRRPKNGIVSYIELIKGPDDFVKSEKRLFEVGIIDENFCFVKKKGNVNVMAAFYHTMIGKNHFNTRNVDKKQDYTKREIVRFLDHRYCATADKTFRNMKNDPDLLKRVVKNEYWLDDLPYCQSR